MIQGLLLLKAGKQKMVGWLCLHVFCLLSCLHGKDLGQSTVLMLQHRRGNPRQCVLGWLLRAGVSKGVILHLYLTGYTHNLTTACHDIPRVGKEKKG